MVPEGAKPAGIRTQIMRIFRCFAIEDSPLTICLRVDNKLIMKQKNFKIGYVEIGLNGPMFLMAGPCVIETKQICLDIANRLADISSRTGIGVIYKASFDKANRSSVSSFRGPGLEKGLEILTDVRREDEIAGYDRCSSARAGRKSRKGRRLPSDSRFFVQADRFALRLCRDGKAGQRQKRASSFRPKK